MTKRKTIPESRRQMHPSVRKGLLPLFLLVILLMHACGEFWEFGGQEVVTADEMRLDRKVVNLMVGDSCVVPVAFVPDSLSDYNIYWYTEADEVARFKGDTLIGMAAGQTRAVAYTTIDRLRDTCYVNVISPFDATAENYRYDMVVYADVTIHGEHLTTANGRPYIIGAFVADQMRGVGQLRNAHGVDYMELRVWSPFASGENITFRCYYRGRGYMELFPDTIVFDGGRHGTLSQLYPLVIDDEAPVYEPDFDYEDYYIEVPDTIREIIIDND